MAEADKIVPVEDLNQDPYRSLVAYPNPTDDTINTRISQLVDLGISNVQFHGALKMGNLSILGKGTVGLVFAAVNGDSRVAVKIRRVDSRRDSLKHEGEMIKAANKAGVGPEYMGSSRDVLKMQFVDGLSLPSWISTMGGRGTRNRIRSAFKTLLHQSVRLDAYGIDHGELSRAHKNVLITSKDEGVILDFESASLMRRVNNFTSITQYLFLSGRFSRKVLRLLGPIDGEELLRYLRLYKEGQTGNAVEAVSKMLRF